jgi:CAAX prenyl protease-like protein
MVVFLALTWLEGRLPAAWYPFAYVIKAAVVTVALLAARPAWRKEIRPEARVLLPALAVGLLTFAEWVVLDRLVLYPHLGARTALNPFDAIADPALRGLFLAVRFYGLVLMVPVMEEVFWRSFLLRYATDQERWASLPLGTFSAFAFILVAAMFAASHPEWLVAGICGMLYAGLLRWTGSLFACVVAHGVTNLALGIYVLATGDWKYW